MEKSSFYIEQLDKAVKAYLRANTELERKIEKEIMINIINEMDNE